MKCQKLIPVSQTARFQNLTLYPPKNMITSPFGPPHAARAVALLFCGMVGLSPALPIVQTYFVPLPDTDLQTSWQAIGTGATIGSTIKSEISIAIPNAGTVIYYDQWEDGYDANPAAPTGTTTQIWGDGDPSNGTAPGYPDDIIPAGGVIVLNNTVTLPRDSSTLFYDGRDRISTTNTIAVARVGWPISPGPVIGTSAEAYDTRKFGNSFQMPIGTQSGAYQQFEYTSIHIMASQDGTVVNVDTDGNGTIDATKTLNMGETMFVNGGVQVGATVNSNKPVEVHGVTGDIGSNYESRTFAVRPTAQWSSGYFAPVTTTLASSPHVVFLYNPGVKAISVNYEGLSTTGIISVPPKGNASFNMPLNSAIHFFTVTGETFYAVGANDAGTANAAANQNWDWGYALMPDTTLTTSIIAPFAPGADDTSAPIGVPDGNGSPVWVTPTATTIVYVNYSGDRATGPNTAPDGSKYDVSYLVPKLGVQTIYNPTTFDMSKSLIFTADSTGLAGGWGEDPSTAGTGLPFLDLGYAIIPFAAPIFSKSVALATDLNANGVIDPGDTVLFTLFLNNDGVTTLENPVFTDVIPPGTTYVANSTVLDGVPVPDNASGVAFPLDGTGVTPPNLVPGASATVKFRVTINAGAKMITNTAQANSASVTVPMLATVTFPISPIMITGSVFNDSNGLSDGIVNGTPTNVNGTIYANIVSNGIVHQVYLVASDGTFRFINIPGNSNYTILLSTTQGIVGNTPPTASLPTGYVNTGENLGLGVANDGNADGILSFSVNTSNVTNANFGIEQIPSATSVTAATAVNPGGTTTVTVPTLSGTDPEDASVSKFVINTLPNNGTLYYNGIAVAAGQVIVSYSSTLLKFDPNDGAITGAFTYSSVDSAGKLSAPATVSMPFSSVGVSGIVYDDANGTTNNTVDGTGNNAGGQLYMNLVLGSVVVQAQAVAADGTFNFLTVPAGTYSAVLSTTLGIAGNAAPAASLPAGYVNTAEKLGTGTGNDGTTDGSLAIKVTTSTVTNARFGFNRLPSAVNINAVSQANPGSTTKVAVPALSGTDPEDGVPTTVILNTLATNGKLYYNNTATTANQTIKGFNPALLTIDPTDNTAITVVSSFTYSVVDAAGMSSPAATVNMPFSGSGISIFGNVFDDADGLTDVMVDGTGTNGGGLYVILVSGGVVKQSVAVSATGSYAFPAVTTNTNYTVILSKTAGTVNSLAPAVSLPSGYVSTGEFIGTGVGNDGIVDSSLAVPVTATTVSNANFGIERTPTATVLTATMANPGGITQVSVPTLVGTDPEDGTLSTFVINTLPTNGTLYYNGTAVIVGQTITSYNPSLLKLDPNDGVITTVFTYSTVDGAGKFSPIVSCTITFTSIGISGKVFDDANGLTDSIVNGTGTNVGGTLYANLISSGSVTQVVEVAANGAYNFGTVAPSSVYTVVLSTTQGSVGSAAPAAALPSGYLNTGEFIGIATGNDGSADGSLIVAVATSSIANADFGIDAIPTASSITAESQVNPAGTTQVTVPTLIGTDPEDASITKFTILSLPTNGTLYYNGTAVTVGQIITGYTASLLKFDPGDGALTATFNYAAVDAAGKSSAAAAVTMPFTTIGITGIVFDDANGLSDGIVNGTGTNASNTLYANLVSGGNVVQSQVLQLAGTYNFVSVVGNTSYTIVISTILGTVGSAAPAAALPAGYVNTGEFIGTTAGNDGVANGSLAVVVTNASITNANFGIEQPPASSDVNAASQINPAGTNRVVVPPLIGTDPEEITTTSFKINTLPTNGTLYYNGSAVTTGQTIVNYNPALLTLDPNDGAITTSFTYSAVDAAGQASASSTATIPFTAMGLSGKVYLDANGLLGTPANTVDGILYSGATLYANLMSGGTVEQVASITSGVYSFGTVAANTNYTVVLSTTQGTIGSAAPMVALPAGYVSTGENIGTGPGSDGSPDGLLVVTTMTTSISYASFGIERTPTANNVTAASQVNPAGTTQVPVPALTGTDPEDPSVTTFIINTLPSNGTLYYNGSAVTVGQTISSYNATLLKLDPNDGAITASFTYSAVDAAGKPSGSATVTMPFTSISIAGNVYNDANCLLGTPVNTVDGTMYSGATLYANLVSGGNVSQVATVTSGKYSFGTVAANTNYTVVLSTTQGTVGSAAPVATLPSGYVNTGENVGSGSGNDGNPNGILAVAVTTTSITNANFGVREQGDVTGHLYIDTNGNGTQDVGEPDLANVDVIVTDAFGATQTVTTNASGNWTANVPPGSTTANIQTSDPQYPTGYTQTQGISPTTVTAIAGTSVSAGNNGYFLPGSITGSVLADTHNDGIGDAPIAGVILTLVDANGNPLDGDPSTSGVQPITATTATDGSYGFGNLPPGIYGVVETQPIGYNSVSDKDGGNPNEIRPIVVAAGVPNADNNFIDIQFGSIHGSVSANGKPLAGVTLTLLDHDGNPVLDGHGNPSTTVSGADGSYTFSGIVPGSYQVQQTQPFGYNSFGDRDGGNLNVIGDVTPITVLPGQVNNDNDFVEALGTCPDTWAEWEFEHPGETASGNPDMDALDNLAEFAFAKPFDSGAGDAWQIQPSVSVPGEIDAVFVRPKGAWQNVTYTLEYVNSLASPITWSSVEIIPAMGDVVDNSDCTETVTVKDLETLTGMTDGTGFVRIRVDLDENNDNTIHHTSRTEVEGWKETSLGLCCRTYNNPFLRSTVLNGTIDGVGAHTLDLTTSAGSVDLATLFTPGVSYYAEVTQGENEGHRFDLVSASGGIVTLASDSDLHAAMPPFNTLTGDLPASLVGNEIVIRRHWTLNDLFPPASFGATDDRTTADQVQLFGDGQWSIYWLCDDGILPARWVKTGDNTYADQGSLVISPGVGMFFNNRTAPTSILAYGEVRANDFISPIAAGSSLIAGGFPLDQSPVGTGSRGMSPAAGFFGSRDIATADTFYVWDRDTIAGASGYSSYFLNNNAPRVPSLTKWAQVGDPSLLRMDSVLLLHGDASVFLRSATGIDGYEILIPWNP